MGMRDGVCPQCRGKNVHYHAPTGYRSYMVLDLFKSVRVSDFVCVACGYVESYVLSKRDLTKLRDSLQRVGDESDAGT